MARKDNKLVIFGLILLVLGLFNLSDSREFQPLETAKAWCSDTGGKWGPISDTSDGCICSAGTTSLWFNCWEKTPVEACDELGGTSTTRAEQNLPTITGLAGADYLCLDNETDITDQASVASILFVPPPPEDICCRYSNPSGEFLYFFESIPFNQDKVCPLNPDLGDPDIEQNIQLCFGITQDTTPEPDTDTDKLDGGAIVEGGLTAAGFAVSDVTPVKVSTFSQGSTEVTKEKKKGTFATLGLIGLGIAIVIIGSMIATGKLNPRRFLKRRRF